MLLQGLQETVRAVANGQLGSLQIGFTTSMLYRGMTETLRDFQKNVPMVECDLIDMPVHEQVEALQQGRIHAAFSTSLTLPRGLAGHRLEDDALACCVHESHWLADRQRVKLSALAEETFVLFSRDTTAAGHELVMQMCVAAGFYPKVRYYVRQWLSAVAMVSQGFGVALVPMSMAKAALPDVRLVALDDPLGQLSAYLLWNPGSISPALERLIAHVTQAPAKRATRRRSTR